MGKKDGLRHQHPDPGASHDLSRASSNKLDIHHASASLMLMCSGTDHQLQSVSYSDIRNDADATSSDGRAEVRSTGFQLNWDTRPAALPSSPHSSPNYRIQCKCLLFRCHSERLLPERLQLGGYGPGKIFIAEPQPK